MTMHVASVQDSQHSTKTDLLLGDGKSHNKSEAKYSGISIYRFSREWRKQTMNMGKRLTRKTTFFNKKSRTLSFASSQNLASIENMTFRDLKCFHGPRQLHCADTR
jgi:hypothetical protein